MAGLESNSEYNGWLVTSDVPQSLVLEQVRFSVFIYWSSGQGIESPLSQFAGDTKLDRNTDLLEDYLGM